MGFRSYLPFISVGGTDTSFDLGSGVSVSVAALGKAAPSGNAGVPTPPAFWTYLPFKVVQALGPPFDVGGGVLVNVGAKAKAGINGSLSYPGSVGFPSYLLFPISGAVETGVVTDIGSVSVGAFALSGLTGDSVEDDPWYLEDLLDIGALGKSGVAGSISTGGFGGFVLGSVSVSALGRGILGADLNGVRYGYAIDVGRVDALGRSTILSGNIFEPIEFNLGNVSVRALGMAMPSSYGVGQPAIFDFIALESGAYGMPTTVNIWNMALSHIGSKHFVESDSERSREVSVLKIHWAAAVNKVLSDRPWKFATKYAALGLIRENPNPDWAFAYRYPADCVFARRLATTVGRRDPDPKPFTIGQDNWGRIVYTDEANAMLEYTMRVFETERYDPQFVTMLSWYLAHLIANPLSRITNSAEVAFNMYKLLKETAASTALNESQMDDAQDAEWIQARL